MVFHPRPPVNVVLPLKGGRVLNEQNEKSGLAQASHQGEKGKGEAAPGTKGKWICRNACNTALNVEFFTVIRHEQFTLLDIVCLGP